MIRYDKYTLITVCRSIGFKIEHLLGVDNLPSNRFAHRLNGSCLSLANRGFSWLNQQFIPPLDTELIICPMSKDFICHAAMSKESEAKKEPLIPTLPLNIRQRTGQKRPKNNGLGGGVNITENNIRGQSTRMRLLNQFRSAALKA